MIIILWLILTPVVLAGVIAYAFLANRPHTPREKADQHEAAENLDDEKHPDE